MRTIELPKRFLAVAATALMVLLAACGTAGPQSASSDPGASPSPDGQTERQPLPARLKSALASTGIVVVDRALSPGESEDAILQAFNKEYDVSSYGARPEVYPVLVQGSADRMLTSVTTAMVVHVANVPQDASGPVHSDGSTPTPVTVMTDMFAFFTRDGTFVETTYVGT